MSFIKAKQIRKMFEAPMVISGFTTSAGTSNIVTSSLSTIATSEGVPVQVANETNFTRGFVVSGNNIVDIVESASKTAIQDKKGNEIYGRLTKPGADYIVTFYSLVGGVETEFSIQAGIPINLVVAYLYDFNSLPSDALRRIAGAVVGQDPTLGAVEFQELLTVSSTNTVSNLAKSPISNSEPMQLIINGQIEDNLSNGAFSISGKIITWNQTNAGYPLETGDRVVAKYKTFE